MIILTSKEGSLRGAAENEPRRGRTFGRMLFFNSHAAKVDATCAKQEPRKGLEPRPTIASRTFWIIQWEQLIVFMQIAKEEMANEERAECCAWFPKDAGRSDKTTEGRGLKSWTNARGYLASNYQSSWVGAILTIVIKALDFYWKL